MKNQKIIRVTSRRDPQFAVYYKDKCGNDVNVEAMKHLTSGLGIQDACATRGLGINARAKKIWTAQMISSVDIHCFEIINFKNPNKPGYLGELDVYEMTEEEMESDLVMHQKRVQLWNALSGALRLDIFEGKYDDAIHNNEPHNSLLAMNSRVFSSALEYPIGGVHLPTAKEGLRGPGNQEV